VWVRVVVPVSYTQKLGRSVRAGADTDHVKVVTSQVHSLLKIGDKSENYRQIR